MDPGINSPREQLIAEGAHARGYLDGVNATLEMLQKRGISYAHGFEDGIKILAEGQIKRVLTALAEKKD